MSMESENSVCKGCLEANDLSKVDLGNDSIVCSSCLDKAKCNLSSDEHLKNQAEKCGLCELVNDFTKVEIVKKHFVCASCIHEANKAVYIADNGTDEQKAEVMSDKPQGVDLKAHYEKHFNEIQADIKKIENPIDMFNKVSETVIGQEYAKKMISTAVYQHKKRMVLHSYGLSDLVKKSNLFLIGRTGTGKTLMAQTIAKICDTPMFVQDATALTQSGYIGDDVNEIVAGLVNNKCGGNSKKAEGGIVFIDEIDKISRGEDSNQRNKDPASDGVQSALLKMVEGTDVKIPIAGGRNSQGNPTMMVDTRNILFIASGAFDGIEEIIKKDVGAGKAAIGFVGQDEKKNIDDNDLLRLVTTKHFVAYGMKPEFMGRFGTIVPFEVLTSEIVKRIILEPKGSYWGSQKIMAELEGVELSIEDDAIDAIAEHVIKTGVGARGIDGILNDALADFSFDSPTTAIKIKVITKSDILDAIDKKLINQSH